MALSGSSRDRQTPTEPAAKMARMADEGRAQSLVRTPRKRWPGVLVGAAGFALVAAGIVAGIVFWVLGLTQTDDLNPWNEPDAPDLYGMVRSTAAITAVLGAAVGLVLALRKQQATEQTTKVAVERHELDAIAALRDRYTTAAQQLGDDSPVVRLAGVYAVSALADDWTARNDPDETQTCIDVLCAYLRTPRSYPTDVDKTADREVRQTIVRTITAHLKPDAPKHWHGRNIDFTEAIFDFTASFNGATFSGQRTSFDRATFSGQLTSFNGATFSGQLTSFGQATFSGEATWFNGATFSGQHTSFNGATFSGQRTSFDQATFSGQRTSFDWATFSAQLTSFGEATFSGESTSFDWATFSGEDTWFNGATFSGQRTSFGQATFSGEATSFDWATFSGQHTSFDQATFSGQRTSFDQATFSGQRTSFGEATFSGQRTSFDQATFSGRYARFRSLTVGDDASSKPVLRFGSLVAPRTVISFQGLTIVGDARLSFVGLVVEGSRAAVVGPWYARRPPQLWPPTDAT